MIPEHLDRVLLWGAAAHLLTGLVCLVVLVADAAPILGVHPALKPMKFGFSIAIFLATMALVVPALSVDPAVRRGIAWTLLLTMIAEMVPILVQAMRGTTSHFNIQGPFNSALWQVMVVAVVVAAGVMVFVAVVASVRPLKTPEGAPMSPLLTAAWRAGLWLFLVSAVSGFGMGGRLRHSVGGPDGGPGLPLVNWSVTHGDLRVSHFFALHALQVIPLLGVLVTWLPIAGPARWMVLVSSTGVYAFIVVGTLLQAFASRPVW